jgi:hypothetical protein
MPKAFVRYHIEFWPCNWRRGIENAADAHAMYVHRNSIRSGIRPISFSGHVGERQKIVNGRYALNVGRSSAYPAGRAPAEGQSRTASRPQAAKRFFPKLGHSWPKSRWRRLWTWMFDWASARSYKAGRMCDVEEWSNVGNHLPSIVRRDTLSFVYTRVNVPVAAELSQQVYYHWARASNWLGRLYEALHWHLYGNWSFDINFSQQDLRAVNNQRYDTEEYFTSTDSMLVSWRKLCTMARDFQGKQPAAAPPTPQRVEQAAPQPAPAAASRPEGY